MNEDLERYERDSARTRDNERSELRDEFQLGPEPERREPWIESLSRMEEACRQIELREHGERTERALADHFEPVRVDYAQRERIFQRMRDTLVEHGIPFPRANFLAEKLLPAFLE